MVGWWGLDCGVEAFLGQEGRVRKGFWERIVELWDWPMREQGVAWKCEDARGVTATSC